MYQSPKLGFGTTDSLSKANYLIVILEKKGTPPSSLQKRVGLAPLERLKNHAALQGERGAKLFFHGDSGAGVFGFGNLLEVTPQDAWDLGENLGHALSAEKIEEVHLQWPADFKDSVIVLAFLKGLSLSSYVIDEFKSKKQKRSGDLRSITIDQSFKKQISPDAFSRLSAIVDGIVFTRNLVELPASIANPEGIVSRFSDAAQGKLELEVWDEKKIAREGMGLLQAVSQGSPTPPRFLITRYGKSFAAKKGTLFLIGKGVTFDTGGVNLKVIPYKELLWMKKDMGGAAAVLGAMLAIAAIKPEIAVVGVTPLTSNILGSKSVLPGDVVTSYNGKTVEIQNTDAEGRLILADAIHYAIKEKATYIVDVATLTGACMIALGHYQTGLFSNNSGFESLVRSASNDCGEPAWPMPMGHRYGEELVSGLADLSNMGTGREGGAITAAKFLESFVGKTRWAHLDIAGTVDASALAGAPASVKASGRMVHTFVELALRLAMPGNV